MFALLNTINVVGTVVVALTCSDCEQTQDLQGLVNEPVAQAQSIPITVIENHHQPLKTQACGYTFVMGAKVGAYAKNNNSGVIFIVANDGMVTNGINCTVQLVNTPVKGA